MFFPLAKILQEARKQGLHASFHPGQGYGTLKLDKTATAYAKPLVIGAVRFGYAGAMLFLEANRRQQKRLTTTQQLEK